MQEDVEAVIVPVGPNKAIIYSGTEAVNNPVLEDDEDETFFQHTLEEVKVRIALASIIDINVTYLFRRFRGGGE